MTTCPNCGALFTPAVEIQELTVCGLCGASVVVATGLRATGDDTLRLSEAELTQLRAARKRPKRTQVG